MDTSFKTKNPVAEGIEIIQLLNNCGSSKSRLLLSSRLRIRGNHYFFIPVFLTRNYGLSQYNFSNWIGTSVYLGLPMVLTLQWHSLRKLTMCLDIEQLCFSFINWSWSRDGNWEFRVNLSLKMYFHTIPDYVLYRGFYDNSSMARVELFQLVSASISKHLLFLKHPLIMILYGSQWKKLRELYQHFSLYHSLQKFTFYKAIWLNYIPCFLLHFSCQDMVLIYPFLFPLKDYWYSPWHILVPRLKEEGYISG